MLRSLTAFILAGLFFLVLSGSIVSAETVCSKVTIEIAQELTLERIAFDAKMVITNNLPDKDLTDINVDISIVDADGVLSGEQFFIRKPDLTNVTDVGGAGIVGSGQRAEAHWLIIPSPGAGGTDRSGKYYWVGAILTYTINGQQETVEVNPDRILVRPEAQLVLDYFIPYKVLGDNPFTPEVESPVPFPLAVRVANDGYGDARSLKIESAQPQITENEQGLLIDFTLLGASVRDASVDPALTVNIGDLPSNEVAVAYWEMISTLSGKFIGFDVSFTHSADLGGELTSIIRETNEHYFHHFVKADLPGRDGYLDILADTDNDDLHLPDTIFESEIVDLAMGLIGTRSDVSVVGISSVSGRPTVESPEVTVEVGLAPAGWIYAEFEDPSSGLLSLNSVIRSDGKILDINNYWSGEELDEQYQSINKIYFVDYRDSEFSASEYIFNFEKPVEDLTSPVTELIFEGPYKIEGSNIFITSETMLIFMSEDNPGGSGVEQVFRKIGGLDTAFVPAFPVKITNEGEISVEYYGIDRSGNQEDIRSGILNLDNSAPVINRFESNVDSISPLIPDGLTGDTEATFFINALDSTDALTASLIVSPGELFAENDVVWSADIALISGIEQAVVWDGTTLDGANLSPGIYTVRIYVTDGLDGAEISHTSYLDLQIELTEWFAGTPLSPDSGGSQENPDINGSLVVWQDMRNGSWDIYARSISSGSQEVRVTGNTSDQTWPAVYGDIIVWQDNRNGDWDIYAYDISSGSESVIYSGMGDQQRPAINGDWISWQGNESGNWDVYLMNIASGQVTRVSTHERDQMYPSLSGELLVWEDYRHGAGEIYSYSLLDSIESRLTYDISSQTLPTVFGQDIVWTDMRNGDGDIYLLSSAVESRVTYASGAQTQASLFGNTVVYTDYGNGSTSTDLAFYDIQSGRGAQLTSDASRQEAPSFNGQTLVWQDDQTGVFQIYWAELDVQALPIVVRLKPGFNLVAVGKSLSSSHSTAGALVNDVSAIDMVVTNNALNGTFFETSSIVDFVLRGGEGIGIYASDEVSLELASAGETHFYTLYPGTNYIGLLNVPPGYSAYDVLGSIGVTRAHSIRKFDSAEGAWLTAAIVEKDGGPEIVGIDFQIKAGDGLIVVVDQRIDGWKP